ncbi:hypothetical protein [Vibrio harveyi]|uniref:hypothetical protein n=1 Tax=Vibrio harveyi TaxID=669 RepID=UPI00165D8754|nr:hypothetical protein [Vibrio harveyi]EKO3801463.1 hypothetical protein [Vibrio harveyi]EKO3862057.1 hypothetical protein [Vibrio harveyi]
MINFKCRILAIFFLVFSGFSYSNPTLIRHNFNLSANIKQNTNDFYVMEVGTGSNSTIVFKWDDETKDFIMPNQAPIYLKIKAKNNVSVYTSTLPQLKSNQGATIPIKINMQPEVNVSSLAGKVGVDDINTIKKTVYTVDPNETTGVATGTEVTFGVTFKALKTGMTDKDQTTVSKPQPGSYSASIALIFESDLS